MELKYLIISLFVVLLALSFVNGVSAEDNGNALANNINNTQDIEITQDYYPSTINKGDIFTITVNVENKGSDEYHNLTVLYPIPEGLDLVIWSDEYNLKNQTWLIKSLAPHSSSKLTFVCTPIVADTTFSLTATVSPDIVSKMDIYVSPLPIDPNTNGSSNGSYNNSNNSDVITKLTTNTGSDATGNPVLMLLLTTLSIPLIRFKKY